MPFPRFVMIFPKVLSSKIIYTLLPAVLYLCDPRAVINFAQGVDGRPQTGADSDPGRVRG